LLKALGFPIRIARRSQELRRDCGCRGWYRTGFSGRLLTGYNQAVSTHCQTHRDLRSAYGEAVETLRSALLVLGDAAGYPDEPEVCAAAQERVTLERTRCESLFKALKAHLSQHQCAPVRTAAWTATRSR